MIGKRISLYCENGNRVKISPKVWVGRINSVQDVVKLDKTMHVLSVSCGVCYRMDKFIYSVSRWDKFM